MNSEPAIIIAAVMTLANGIIGFLVHNGTIPIDVGTSIATLLTFIGGIITRQYVSPAAKS